MPRTLTKRRSDVPATFFRVEAAGLAWLAASGAVRVPAVIGVGDTHIELERLDAAAPSAAAAQRLGRQLAALHDAGADAFGAAPHGWDGDGFIGDAPLPLRAEASWGSFYARHRVLPYAHAAADAGALAPGASARIERLCAALESGTFDDDAPPARIHGDLWAGNVLWTPTGPALIDPAAHGGHRVTDLAMLALFGLPHLPAVLDAYADASAHLSDDWRSLVPLHQVHPLLVHAVLFGGGYGAAALDAVDAALALAG